MTRTLLCLAVFLFAAADASAIRIRRSFRPARYDVGGGTSVVGPAFDMKPSVRFDESAARASKPRVRSFVGTVTRVEDGDTVYVTPPGGARKRVVLDRIDAPGLGQPHGAESKRLLSDLVLNRKVEVKWSRRDSKGATFGVMFLAHEKGAVDVNLSMILSGAARYGGNADGIPAYPKAEASARAARIGLWAADDPVRPEDRRKGKTK